MVSNEGKITGHISKCYLWNKHKDGSLKFWNEIHGYYGPVGKQKYNSGHDTFTEQRELPNSPIVLGRHVDYRTRPYQNCIAEGLESIFFNERYILLSGT